RASNATKIRAIISSLSPPHDTLCHCKRIAIILLSRDANPWYPFFVTLSKFWYDSAMKCAQCGAEMAPGAAFCTSCGARQAPAAPVQPAPPPPGPPAAPAAPAYSAPAGTPIPASPVPQPTKSSKAIGIVIGILLLLFIGAIIAVWLVFFPPGVYVQDSF